MKAFIITLLPHLLSVTRRSNALRLTQMTPFLLVALEFSVQSKGRFKKKPAVTQKLRK